MKAWWFLVVKTMEGHWVGLSGRKEVRPEVLDLFKIFYTTESLILAQDER